MGVMDSLWARLMLVAGGGALGAAGRYGLDLAVRLLWPALAARFPAGILLVNVLGCLVFGLLVGAAGGIGSLSPARRLFLLTGVLGGFTTFSAFGHDTAQLLGSGSGGLALVNALASVVLGVGAVFAGVWFGRLLAGG
jgi:CrcB protein